MECVKCKNKIEDDSVFCRFCGKKQIAERKHRKRPNGSGGISKLPGNRAKPWQAKKNGISIGTYATKSEAQKALERMTDVEVNEKFNMTFSQVYERWYAEHSREVTAKAAQNFTMSYNQCKQLHSIKMRKILRSDYQAAIISLEAEGKSKSTCDKLRALFGQMGRWALNEGIILTNTAADLNTVAKQKSVRVIFTEEQIKKIKKSNLPAADIALILISCGCRPGELFSVPLVNCREDHFIGGSKTEAGKNRVIPIGPDGIEAYKKIREKAISEKHSHLIYGYGGKNKTAQNFAKRDWKELMEEIKAENITPYSCRHTFITRAIRSGMDLPKLEAIVGHLDRETTKIYTHLQAQDLVDAVQSIKSEENQVDYKLSTTKKVPKQKAKKSS